MIDECSGRLGCTEAEFLHDGIDLPPDSVDRNAPRKELTWRALRGTVENEEAFHCTENTEDECTVDGLREMLERGGPEYQLTNDDARKLIGAEEAFKLRECIAKFGPELRGVSKYNPHEDRAGDMKHTTSSRPGTEFHERAIQVDRRLRSPETENDRNLKEFIWQAYDKLRAI